MAGKRAARASRANARTASRTSLVVSSALRAAGSAPRDGIKRGPPIGHCVGRARRAASQRSSSSFTDTLSHLHSHHQDRGPNQDAPGFGRGSGGISDNDTGRNADPAGHGTGQRNVTDNDTGRNADRAGAGNVTDTDRGPNSDRASRGRGITDNDQGRNADPAGAGRGAAVSDNDRGPNADPARGRR